MNVHQKGPKGLLRRFPGPTPLITASNSTDGGMSQGTPLYLLDPSPVNQSEQSSLHHHSFHNSLPPAVYYQPEQPQQVPVAPPPTTQPRESSGASRRARSSGLRIVDPNTNRDVLTGEEVPPSAVVTPTSTTLPEIVANGVVSTPVVAADEVEAPLTAAAMAPSTTEYVRLKYVAFIDKVKDEKKTVVPTVVASSPNMASYKEIGNTGIKYSRENPLGKGAFGDVYRGIYNDEQVAVKKLLLNRYEKEEREVNLQQNLDHENVLKILKVEEDDDFRYIVLELCAGTLDEVIDKTYKGPAYPSDPIVLYQIADGLNYIHTKKLIHRDIKPENILISMNGQQLKLSDFGLSKQISNRDTCSMSGTKGTILWMAPELHGNNTKATPKCDVFPCGCVFFVFLTRENGGIHPFGDMKDHLRLQFNIRLGKPINIDKLKADSYAVPVILEMIKANPLERINLADVKERLRPFSHPDLRPSTTVESVKSTSLNYKDDQRTPVNPEGKRIYDRNFLLELQNNPASKKKPGGLPSLEIVRDKASTKMKRGISVGDFARSTTE